MKSSKIPFCVILLLLISQGCKQEAKLNDAKASIAKSENDLWIEYLNQKSNSILDLYSDDAIKIYDDESIVKGKAAIKDKILSSQLAVKSISTDTVIIANKKRGLAYELGGFIDEHDTKHKHILIWETKSSERKRVFEFSSEIDKSSNDLTDIDARRDVWMKLCNAHNAEGLINEVYSENTIYFNHKPLVIGRSGLIEEYQYMNNEKYKLSLNPIIIDQVSKNLVFEIGQCKGSYNGKYIIIWRKEKSGKWEVFIDSNI